MMNGQYKGGIDFSSGDNTNPPHKYTAFTDITYLVEMTHAERCDYWGCPHKQTNNATINLEDASGNL